MAHARVFGSDAQRRRYYVTPEIPGKAVWWSGGCAALVLSVSKHAAKVHGPLGRKHQERVQRVRERREPVHRRRGKSKDLGAAYQRGGQSCAYDCAAPGGLTCVGGRCAFGQAAQTGSGGAGGGGGGASGGGPIRTAVVTLSPVDEPPRPTAWTSPSRWPTPATCWTRQPWSACGRRSSLPRGPRRPA